MLYTSSAIINKKQDNIQQDTVYEYSIVLLAGYSLISVSSSHQCQENAACRLHMASGIKASVGRFFISPPHVILMCSSCQFSACFPNIT